MFCSPSVEINTSVLALMVVEAASSENTLSVTFGHDL